MTIFVLQWGHRESYSLAVSGMPSKEVVDGIDYFQSEASAKAMEKTISDASKLLKTDLWLRCYPVQVKP